MTKTIAGSVNKEIDDFQNIWFRPKRICRSVNVITDGDSVEMEKPGISNEVD